jgi:hypothetical protein
MLVWRRFRWLLGLGGLKALAVTVLFLYTKHKAAGPPAHAAAPAREQVASRIHPTKSGSVPALGSIRDALPAGK